MIDSRSRVKNTLEGVVIVAIVLVLVHTFVQDLAVLLGWTWRTRRALLIIGFGFDLFFTIEFLVRLYYAILDRAAGRYFWRERGWIDFLAAVPLLLLDSGPAMLAVAAGGTSVLGMGGMMSVLKVAKTIRIARILRLLRVLKVFNAINNADSPMAQRHIAGITTLSVSVIVLSVVAYVGLASAVDMPSLEAEEQARSMRAASFIDARNLADPDQQELLRDYAASQPLMLVVREDGQTRYSRHDNAFYEERFGPGDYGYLRSGEVGVFFDLRPLNADQARQNIAYFTIVVILVLLILLVYSPHFALTVTDPIHVMERGFSERGHNLEVRIPERYRGDDIFRLAALYNSVYLPMKDRRVGGEGDSGGIVDLSVNDVQRIMDEEEGE
ncbi:MAG: ion transporter [Spirochaetaceae bacterium]